MSGVDPRTRPRARHLLRHAEDAEPREAVQGLLPTLRLWREPAFEAFRSWTIFEALPSRPPLVREITVIPPGWSGLPPPLEEVRMKVSRPQMIFIRDAPVQQDELAVRVEAGRRIAVPLLLSDPTTGLDGVVCGLRWMPGFNRFELEWWCDGPPEWRELIAWATELREYLTACIESHPWTSRPSPAL